MIPTSPHRTDNALPESLPPEGWEQYYIDGQNKTEDKLKGTHLDHDELTRLVYPTVKEDGTVAYSPTWLRAALASNPTLDAATLRSLASADEKIVLIKVMLNENVTSEALTTIAQRTDFPDIAYLARLKLNAS